MSTYLDIFNHTPFDSFGQAFIYFVDRMGINRIWICEKIYSDKKKAKNFNTQISRWERTGANPSSQNLNLINKVLFEFFDVTIHQNMEMKWFVVRVQENLNDQMLFVEGDKILNSVEKFTHDMGRFNDFFERIEEANEAYDGIISGRGVTYADRVSMLRRLEKKIKKSLVDTLGVYESK